MNLVMNMMRSAITAHPCIDGLVFHTDQGWQYQHPSFVNCLKANGIVQSMYRTGNCIDNSKMETFFGHMKREMYYGRKFATRKELYEAIDMYIKFVIINTRINTSFSYSICYLTTFLHNIF